MPAKQNVYKLARKRGKKAEIRGKNVSENFSLADSGVTVGMFGEKRLNATRNTIKEAKCIYIYIYKVDTHEYTQ